MHILELTSSIHVCGTITNAYNIIISDIPGGSRCCGSCRAPMYM